MAVAQSHQAPWTRKHDKPGSPLIPRARTIAYPQSLEDLIELCTHRPHGQHLRAAGSHWALSRAAISDDIFIETNDPNNLFPALGRTLYDVVPECLSEGFIKALSSDRPPAFIGGGTAPPSPFYYVHAEAGKRIHQLYAELDGGDSASPRSLCNLLKSRFGNHSLDGSWAFATLGGAGGQTVVGALTTGTHGGDFDRGPIADSVVALHVVTDGGKHYWIERSFGAELEFTDDGALHALYGAAKYGGPQNFEIIRAQDVFRAALVQVGRFGTVYSVVLQVVRQFALLQSLKLDEWENVRGRIADPNSDLFVQPLTLNDAVPPVAQQFLQIVVNPPPVADGSAHTCGITRRWTVPLAMLKLGDPEGRAHRVGRIVTPFDARLNAPRFSEAGASTAYSPDDDGSFNLFQSACANPSFLIGIIEGVYTEIENFLSSHVIETGGALATVVAVGGESLLALAPELLAILALLAALLKFLSDSGTTRLGQVLDDLRAGLLDNPDPAARAAGVLIWRAIAGKVFKSKQKEATYAAISYAMMDLHDYTDLSCEVNVESVEVFFDAADPNLIAFVDRLLLFESIQEFAAGHAVVGYVSLRFTGPTHATLGQQPFPRTCAIECSGLADVAGSADFVAYATRLGLDANLKGILHWGQRNDSTQSEVEFRFGDSPGAPRGPLHEWRAVLSRLTDHGRLDGFSSEFSRRVGLEIVQPRIGSFILVGAGPSSAPPWTLSWDATANPRQTDLTLEIVSPNGAREHVAALPLLGSHSVNAPQSGLYTFTLLASLERNGVTRRDTSTLTASSTLPGPHLG